MKKINKTRNITGVFIRVTTAQQLHVDIITLWTAHSLSLQHVHGVTSGDIESRSIHAPRCKPLTEFSARRIKKNWIKPRHLYIISANGNVKGYPTWSQINQSRSSWRVLLHRSQVPYMESSAVKIGRGSTTCYFHNSQLSKPSLGFDQVYTGPSSI